MRACKPLSIKGRCDWAERAQPTTTQLQRRGVYKRKKQPRRIKNKGRFKKMERWR